MKSIIKQGRLAFENIKTINVTIINSINSHNPNEKVYQE